MYFLTLRLITNLKNITNVQNAQSGSYLGKGFNNRWYKVKCKNIFGTKKKKINETRQKQP